MKAWSFLCAALLLSTIANAMDDGRRSNPFASRSDDGRFGSVCAGASGVTDEPVCIVPFGRLIAVPERYDGKLISLIGFLVSSRGVPTLFPSSENYRAQTVYDNVYIGGDIPRDIVQKLPQGIWVSVVGKFDAKFSGQTMNLGAIWHVASLTARPPVDLRASKPPSFKPVELEEPKAITPKTK